MITDPAWFHSSVAQSAAAIVGLIAAIFGTRLIDHVRGIAKTQSQLVEKLAAIRRYFDNRVLGMARYGPHLRQELVEDEAAIAHGDTERTPTKGMSWEDVEPREDRFRPEILINHRRALQNYLGLWERIHPAYTNLRGKISTRDLRDYVSRLRGLAEEIRPEAAPLNMLNADANLLAQTLLEIEEFRERVFPRIFVIFVALLGWITWFGLFLPLNALRIQAEQLSILRGFAIGVILVVAYFAVEVGRLWLLSRVSWDKGA